MRLVFATLVLLAANDAAARPLVIGRVGMVLRKEMPARALGRAGDDRALVTVRAKGGAERLRSAGFDAGALAGDVAELSATAEELRRLVALPDVIAVEERRTLHPLLDVSGPAIGAPAARAQTGLDGRSVLIGIVDTGVDFRHADFRNSDGTTRAAAVLDLANPRGALHPELPDYGGGAIWLRQDVDAVLNAEAVGMSPMQPVLQRDRFGHGTHVAGIAAANGRATGQGLPAGRYVGIAPAATLLIAQTTRSDRTFSDVDVITASRFILDQAAALNQPVVLNLSLGGAGGGHDGTSNFEAALDALVPASSPGRALVVAAGNGGDLDQHAGAWALAGDIGIPLALPPSVQADAQLSLELWYTGALSVSVQTPTGRSIGPIAQGSSIDAMSDAGHILIDNGASSPPRADGRQPATIALVGNSVAAPASGRWSIVLHGHALRWDLWVSDAASSLSSARFLDQVDEEDQLSIPASAHNAIVVGSVVSRSAWRPLDGMSISIPIVTGDPSSFSAMGPTADGRFAPDLLAPGEFIVSALSMDALPSDPASSFFAGPSDPDFAWADDGVHGVLRGTSQSAPHVAGTIALLLQANPMLTGANLREILRTSANDGGRGYSARRGFGALDVGAALRLARSGHASTVSATASSVGLSRDLVPPGDETTVVTVTPRDDAGTPIGAGHQVNVSTSAGNLVGSLRDLGFGRYEQTIQAHASRGSVAVVTVSVDGLALAAHPSIYFVQSRGEIGRPFAAGGGCALEPRPVTPIAASLALVLAIVLGKSLRRRSGRTLRA